MVPIEIVLASSSPRRAALLRALGIPIRIVEPQVDETAGAAEPPGEHALRLAQAKARAVANRLAPAPTGRVVLAADTIVVAGRALGKPADAADARAMLASLVGRAHEVLTAVHVLRTDSGALAATLQRTVVRFRACDERWIDWYVATGEPFGKAGAYSIQGRGALLCERIEGSWSNVVGLPLEALPELFARVGLDFLAHLTHSSSGADVDLGVLTRDDDAAV